MTTFNQRLSTAGDSTRTNDNGVDTITCHPVKKTSKINDKIIANIALSMRVISYFFAFIAGCFLSYKLGYCLGVTL